MWIIELLVVLFFIWLGARLGSIGIGFAGGFGVLVLALVFGIKPGSIPVDVILIIMSVIAAIAAMQVAGALYHDNLCWDRANSIFNPACHCRGSQGDRCPAFAALGYSDGGVPNCHYRIPYIGSGDFFR